MSWYAESVFYHIYPLGFCGAPFENDGIESHRILQIIDYVPHLVDLGVNAVYFGPVFESDSHGYNTRDYKKIDTRLGTNEDFVRVVDALHNAGIRVVLDGVFNHVGRGFPQFLDVKQRRESSPYRYWFNVDLYNNNHFNDGLSYEGWEGNCDLVRLNLYNNDVVEHLLDAVRYWIEVLKIDGIRLDVAYLLNEDFLRRLRSTTAAIREDFFLFGEMLHGDYNRIMNDSMLHSVTNYECYKGLYSSFNSLNMFEIMHSLKRQFGPEYWTLYKGKHLVNFVDNHDVTRVASILTEYRHLPLIYAVMFGMPGIPCIYYGSEWGVKGEKKDGDPALRPAISTPEWDWLTEYISRLARIKRRSKALNYGDFSVPVLTNKQCVFCRECDGERVYVAVNSSAEEYRVRLDGVGQLRDMISKEVVDGANDIVLSPYTAMYLSNKESE